MRSLDLRRVLAAAPLPGRTLLLCAALLALATPAAADVVTCDDKRGLRLQAGSETTDLEVTGPCDVKAGETYTYRNVNVFRDRRTDPDREYGGTLKFLEPRAGGETHFFAQSIVVEDRGSLIAGTPTQPIGPDGKITIHLWGPEDAPGITCKTDDRCGVPNGIWTSNPNPNPSSCETTKFPTDDSSVTPVGAGGSRIGTRRERAPVEDCFYRYEKLDGSDADARAYFGHKVLALSYGGTLQLFGAKGATYDGRERSKCKEKDPSCTGTSWVRLKGSIQPADASPKKLTVDGAVDWRDGDHFVVTTTDYLPSHSEELIVVGQPTVSGGVTTITYRNADGVTPGVKWPHNGEAYDLAGLPSRLGIQRKTAETRAAVALLSRNIEIVSEGDHPIASSFPVSAGYYGGHTIVRQGFDTYQVQGVRFRQLGQGGRIMHYPVHFHMARRTPQSFDPDEPATFVKDSSIDDSMTRWITIHGTQGVTLARNVGYMSIGHGFYLEDGTETDNILNANIGVFARPAVKNDAINPRNVPGILTATAPAEQKDSSGFDNFPYYSDSNNPAVFWIMNGWNDFHYNMAAGAGTCGACYWLVPGAISGPSRDRKWFGYAGEQRGKDRAALTPLKEFIGNSCSSAMTAFTVNSTTATCNGVNQRDPSKYKSGTMLTMLPSAGATAAYKDQGAGKAPLIDEGYWPTVGGGGRLATRCPAADQQAKEPFLDVKSDCSKVPRCGEGFEKDCDVTVVDKLTTSFNWAEKNLAAVWMRPFWSLVNDSVVTDVQNAGVNFVTSGDFSKASVITGFWSLARKTVFIGSTQKDNPFASNAGPFNPIKSSTLKTVKNEPVSGLACAVDPISGANNVSYCLSQDDGISIQLGSFSAGQRFFSVYDGPAYQESNAYLDIHPTYLTSTGKVDGQVVAGCKPTPNNPNPCPFSGYMNGGAPGVLADMLHDRCYLPNAAIGWKQPNGFYYAPAFHSRNLFFGDGARSVDIRHFVTEPLFDGATFDTDVEEVKKQYCYRGTDQPKPGMFQGFTDIDRETVLNDDDGTLTGLTSKGAWVETISVNKEPFFDAPVETPECASDLPLNATSDAKCAPATAKTSPYEYVTTAIYPECALSVADSDAPLRKCDPYVWGSNCTTSDPSQVNSCVGVNMYRQLLLDQNDPFGNRQLKRMMGQNTFQRSALTANRGVYYIDTTVSAAKQMEQGAKSINVFTSGQKYDLFFLYAKKTTQQTYEMYVGTGKSPDYGATAVKFGYMNIDTAKYRFGAATPPGGKTAGELPKGWESLYDPASGYLTLTIDMASLADDFDLKKPIDPTNPSSPTLGQTLCQPRTMCAWDQGAGTCACTIHDPKDPRYKACQEKNADNQDAICSWSVKELDCPAKGCPALQIAFESYTPDDAPDHHRPPADDFSNPEIAKDWQVPLNPVSASLSGQQCSYTSLPVACGP
ncbi:hypothetical protein K2Z84_02185 [Candidatus Binatia bacterium]|nr:hypothetical protein [Candidatus Binatia bacterium]